MSGDTCKWKSGCTEPAMKNLDSDYCAKHSRPAYCGTPVEEQPAGEQWLDAPTGKGAYWKSSCVPGAKPFVVEVTSQGNFTVSGDGDIYCVSDCEGVKWQRIHEPTPPPAPLPKSKQVTLTARVTRDGVDIFVDGDKVGTQPYAPAAIREVRKRFKIEPVVVEGGEA